MKCIRPEKPVATCNECGMMYVNGTCLFEICPKASLEFCKKCTNLVEVPYSGGLCRCVPEFDDRGRIIPGDKKKEPEPTQDDVPAQVDVPARIAVGGVVWVPCPIPSEKCKAYVASGNLILTCQSWEEDSKSCTVNKLPITASSPVKRRHRLKPMGAAAPTMRALSIRQPWTDLIFGGSKVIEVRSRSTSFRGRFLLHVPLQLDKEAMDYFKVCNLTTTLGAIVGVADLTDVIKYITPEQFAADKGRHRWYKSFEQEDMPQYGYVLQDVGRLVSPQPWKGQLGFFSVPIGGGSQ